MKVALMLGRPAALGNMPPAGSCRRPMAVTKASTQPGGGSGLLCISMAPSP